MTREVTILQIVWMHGYIIKKSKKRKKNKKKKKAKKEKENKNNVLRTFLMTIKSISKQYVVNRHNPELMHTSVL